MTCKLDDALDCYPAAMDVATTSQRSALSGGVVVVALGAAPNQRDLRRVCSDIYTGVGKMQNQTGR